MINVKYENSEEFDSIRNKATQIITDQGYTHDYIKTYIANNIASKKYHGIELAYNSEYGNKVTKEQVLNFADDFIINHVYSAIADSGDDTDCIDVVNDTIKENGDEIQQFNGEFSELEERESKDYQEEIDGLNRYYYSTRGVNNGRSSYS